MRSRSRVQTFSTSFLDLLSCSLGGVTFLALVLAAQSPAKKPVEMQSTFLSVLVQDGTAGVGLALELPTGVFPLGEYSGSPLLRFSYSPKVEASESYALNFQAVEVPEDAWLWVFLADFNGGNPDTEVTIQMQSSKSGLREETLSPQRMGFRINLSDLLSTTKPLWHTDDL